MAENQWVAGVKKKQDEKKRKEGRIKGMDLQAD